MATGAGLNIARPGSQRHRQESSREIVRPTMLSDPTECPDRLRILLDPVSRVR